VRDEKSIGKLQGKLEIIEQELIDLKTKGRTANRITGNLQGGLMSQVGFAEKFDIMVEEVNQMWAFI
jgi:hypothetical protein